MSKKRFLYNPIYIKKYEKNDSYCRVHKFPTRVRIFLIKCTILFVSPPDFFP